MHSTIGSRGRPPDLRTSEKAAGQRGESTCSAWWLPGAARAPSALLAWPLSPAHCDAPPGPAVQGTGLRPPLHHCQGHPHPLPSSRHTAGAPKGGAHPLQRKGPGWQGHTQCARGTVHSALPVRVGVRHGARAAGRHTTARPMESWEGMFPRQEGVTEAPLHCSEGRGPQQAAQWLVLMTLTWSIVGDITKCLLSSAPSRTSSNLPRKSLRQVQLQSHFQGR